MIDGWKSKFSGTKGGQQQRGGKGTGGIAALSNGQSAETQMPNGGFRRIGALTVVKTVEDASNEEDIVPYVKIYGDGKGTGKGKSDEDGFERPKKPIKARPTQ